MDGNLIRLDGDVVKMNGLRAAAATQTRANTEHLISQLDEYKAHGLNAVAVFYAGARYNHSTPWSSDGTLDPAAADRMQQIAEACRVRDMVLIAGIFYQHAALGLSDEQGVVNVTRNVAASLRPWRNVIINPANEQNSSGWGDTAHVFDFREPSRILQLCSEVHDVDPARLAGGGGYDTAKNIEIARDPECDVALWDTGDYNAEGTNTDTRYEDLVAAGVTKPQVNVEIFGGWTRTRLDPLAGYYTSRQKDAYLLQARAAETRPGLGVFWHDNRWTQPEDSAPRYDLAGYGTREDVGWRWYAEAVRDGAAVGLATRWRS